MHYTDNPERDMEFYEIELEQENRKISDIEEDGGEEKENG